MTTDTLHAVSEPWAALLPPDVFDRLNPKIFTYRPKAAALRMLAVFHEGHQVWQFVGASHIRWAPMLEWARGGKANRCSNCSAMCIELAASMAGYEGARVDLRLASFILGQNWYFDALHQALNILFYDRLGESR